MRVFGVVMAGGGGTRFWPMSRRKIPKQLLNLSGREVLINETIDRFSRVIDRNDLFVVTNVDQSDRMREAVAGRIADDHILWEPFARNTAACIGYAAMEIQCKYGDSMMVVTPSDAHVRNIDVFSDTLKTAVAAAEREDKLVTIGIEPCAPATGYGYIQYDRDLDEPVKPVYAFVEKPDEETARGYLAEGNYLWNSGIFVWKTSVILEKFRIYIPDVYENIMRIGSAINTTAESRTISDVYQDIRSISVDYAILEPAARQGDVLVVPGKFGWSDVGSWDMIGNMRDADGDGNILSGDVYAVNAKNNVVYATSRTVTVVGVEDLVVVETADTVLVCPKSRAQDVKNMVALLEEEGREDLL